MKAQPAPHVPAKSAEKALSRWPACFVGIAESAFMEHGVKACFSLQRFSERRLSVLMKGMEEEMEDEIHLILPSVCVLGLGWHRLPAWQAMPMQSII